MASENSTFNVLEHDLVPEHHLLTEEEAQKVLQELNITKDKLPKISRSDAALKVLETIRGAPIEEGSIIKIVRNSETAGKFVAYRLVIRGGIKE